MSWSVDVIAPEGAPEISERVASFCDCPGNICTSVVQLGYDKLPHIENPEIQMKVLKVLIEELNRGNAGKIHDQYCVDCDEKWSKGRESKEKWAEFEPFKDRMKGVSWMESYAAFTGHTTRERMLKDAEHYYLLLKSGYRIQFTW